LILGRKTLKVVRDIGRAHVGGQYQPSLAPPFFVVASVQPMDPKAVEMLPESARLSAKFALFADALQPELKTTELSGQTEADRVEYRGKQYRVTSLGDWTAHAAGIPHNAYAMLLIGDDESVL
jgi:hypothetical protein